MEHRERQPVWCVERRLNVGAGIFRFGYRRDTQRPQLAVGGGGPESSFVVECERFETHAPVAQSDGFNEAGHPLMLSVPLPKAVAGGIPSTTRSVPPTLPSLPHLPF